MPNVCPKTNKAVIIWTTANWSGSSNKLLFDSEKVVSFLGLLDILNWKRRVFFGGKFLLSVLEITKLSLDYELRILIFIGSGFENYPFEVSRDTSWQGSRKERETHVIVTWRQLLVTSLSHVFYSRLADFVFVCHFGYFLEFFTSILP